MLLEWVQPPSIEKGERAGASCFGDRRATALVGPLRASVHAVNGFADGSLRALVAGLPGSVYTSAQTSYDLCRLRLKGLIRRLEHRNLYVLTHDGVRIAVFYTKLHDRLLGPLFAIDQPTAQAPLRAALRIIERSIDDYVQDARIAA